MNEVYITLSLIFLRSVNFLLRCKTVDFNIVIKKIIHWQDG